MKSKITMPKNKAELENLLWSAFMAGCNHEDVVDHYHNISGQRELGFQYYLGKISREEMWEGIEEIQSG